MGKSFEGEISGLPNKIIPMRSYYPAVTHTVDTEDGRLTSDDFASWKDAKRSTRLLVTAPPGSGKSGLSNFVAEHLESRMKYNDKVIYYFCNIRNDAASRNAASILRALIIQLCETQKPLFQILPLDFAQDSSRFFSAHVHTLLHIFESMLRAASYAQVYCVIDGLDAYQDDNDDMNELMAGLKQIFNNDEGPNPVLKLFCTARPYRWICDHWDKAQSRTLRCNDKDVVTFTHSRTESLPFDKGIKDAIKKRLDSKTERTFLWIEVVTRKPRSLDFPSIKDVENVIKGSSEELYELYKDLVNGALQKGNKHARLLVWAVYAKRPLECAELEEAIAIGPQDRYKHWHEFSRGKPLLTPDSIYQSLGTLLDVIDNKVCVIHQSVKDFFEHRKESLEHAFGGMSPRLFTAYACMSYLVLEDSPFPTISYGDDWNPWGGKRGLYELCKRCKLFRYASKYWHKHLESAEDVYSGGLLLQEVVKQVVNPSLKGTILWVKYAAVPFHLDRLHLISDIAIMFDIGWLAKLLLDERIEGLPDDFEGYYLSKHVEIGRSAFKVLLRHDKERWREYMQSGDFVARVAKEGDAAAMDLLLGAYGTNLNITSEVVENAAKNQFSGLKIMKLIIDTCGSEVQITPGVIEAAANNQKHGLEIIKLLLEARGYEVPITPNVVKAVALNNGQGVEIMKLLLEVHAEESQVASQRVEAVVENEKSGLGMMAQYFISRRNECRRHRWYKGEDFEKRSREDARELLTFFSEKSVDINAATDDGQTALHLASTYGNRKSVTFLLEKGADVRAVDNFGYTSLRKCVAYHMYELDRVEICKDLLAQDGLDPNFKDKHGCTALALAVQYGSKRVVEMLLQDKRVDKNIQDKAGRTPLLWAVRKRALYSVSLLLPCREEERDRVVFEAALSMGSESFSNLARLMYWKKKEEEEERVYVHWRNEINQWETPSEVGSRRYVYRRRNMYWKEELGISNLYWKVKEGCEDVCWEAEDLFGLRALFRASF